MTRALAALALVTSLASLATGCGGGDDETTITVSAASSLEQAFETYADDLDGFDARFSFAGSDELAAQIKQGAHPDVFASANTTYPDELNKARLVEKPDVFIGNDLVIAFPADNPAGVGSISDLAKPGLDLVIGTGSVPVGSYTREVLGELPSAERSAIQANVRSREPDVTAIVGKLTQGAADAAFLYTSDVEPAGDQLQAISLPTDLAPRVQYGIAVVSGTDHVADARAFIDGLLDPSGQKLLEENGFKPAG
jgi:molybdate transport system substrate-binding protein